MSEKVSYYDEGSETVLGHIEQALTFLENNKGSHGLILIKFGDWNDSLTAIGKEGRGESVWISIAYAEALRQMSELSQYLEDNNRKSDFEMRRKTISDAVNNNAWVFKML